VFPPPPRGETTNGRERAVKGEKYSSSGFCEKTKEEKTKREIQEERIQHLPPGMDEKKNVLLTTRKEPHTRIPQHHRIGQFHNKPKLRGEKKSEIIGKRGIAR